MGMYLRRIVSDRRHHMVHDILHICICTGIWMGGITVGGCHDVRIGRSGMYIQKPVLEISGVI